MIRNVNGYEEVREVEITNHSQGTIEGGKIVFTLAYNGSFAGGCMAPPKSAQTQNDVIFIPALDPGKTFEFVAVNQTAGCAWLLPSEKITVKMASDETAAEIPLKIEPTVVANWMSSPFAPTAVKWEGVPARNPGYGMVSSGAVCQATQRPTDRLETRNRLAELLSKGQAIKAKCVARYQWNSQPQPVPGAPEYPCIGEINKWQARVAAYLGSNMEPSYKARFDAAYGPELSYGMNQDNNSAVNVLSYKSQMLGEFLKELQ
jgi:hypothetical protein